ncbi:MAG: hypothetical protein RR696_06570, partial [Clostridia bacterium]
MKSRWFRHQISLRSFILYFCCITIPLCLLAANSVARRIQQEEASYLQAMTDKAVRICEQVDSQFEYLEQTANEIYRAGWYGRYISKSALYQNELNIVKQLEISRDLMYKCTLLSLANDILVLNIQKNAVICKYGWFGSVQKYMDVYCNLDLSDAKEYVLDQRLTEAVRSLDGEQFALSYPDPNGNRDC